MLIFAIIGFAAFTASFFGVRWFRAFTLRRGLLDIPNERSSHVVPTPRGGGLVMAVVAICAYILGNYILGEKISTGYLIGAAIIVLIGWLDDVYSLSFIWRFMAQCVAAAIVIYFSGAITSFYLPGFGIQFELGWFSNIVTALLIVWLLNAYNFMDGIDGIGGLQALIAGLSWFGFGILISGNGITVISLALAATAFGFLLHNWQPAKIFMGDAGSSFLGFSFAVLPIIARTSDEAVNSRLSTFALFAIWPFVFDSAFTIFRRGLRGAKIWSAHREHLYQRFVIGGYEHWQVAVFYGSMSAIVALAAVVILSATTASATDFMLVVIAIFTAGFTIVFASRHGKAIQIN